ncbi:hypothetical protein ADK67_44035 [Saccharothrix sp. NRRL B-16348]|uniref:hypothetical protein n=1 Tax=Saccharothrix sp. NRRL B-16348 TaxID=1415542 RepID=UPI0006AD92B5|nr:hypothetical protein [Saccharothrix sp. NRRL B-16348]KOX13653.1 hypothetical protein ADK67_44035 [Saccharothrix sp. NRRL B-16348]
MTRTRAVAIGAAALVGIALLGASWTGEGRPAAQESAARESGVQESGVQERGDGPVGAAPKKAENEVAPAADVSTAVVPGLGTVLTDGEGRTLYRFDRDTAKPSTSTCDGGCAEQWPPVLATSGDVRVRGVDQALVATLDRADGTRQVTVAGWPVYRFADDAAPGEAKGQGVGGTWFVAAPDGKKAAPAAGLVLTTASVGALGTVLTDRDGMTLYRFDEDSAKPSASNCDGDCATKWPPLLVDSPQFEVRGVDPSLVGSVTRADGSLQATVAGWPLYLFADDVVCGDAKGQGVGGVWFAARPDGLKAG